MHIVHLPSAAARAAVLAFVAPLLVASLIASTAPVAAQLAPLPISVSPANYNGLCPTVLTFTSTINTKGFPFPANGPKTITYVWTRSDGGYQKVPTVATPNAAGIVVATYTWTQGPISSSGWVALDVTAPVNATSGQANFTVTCSNAPTPAPQTMPQDCFTSANLLKNWDFSSGRAPTSFTGQGESGVAASDWSMLANLPSTITTDWLSSFAGRSGVLHVTTNQDHGGLQQAYGAPGTGPAHTMLRAWVYVVSGRVGIANGNAGKTGPDMFSGTNGAWELLRVRNETSPSNEAVIYAASPGGAEFYVDSACVLPDT